MSVAAPFRFQRHFPGAGNVCITQLNVPTSSSSNVVLLRDMTLENAMKWQWNLETIQFDVNFTSSWESSLGTLTSNCSASFFWDKRWTSNTVGAALAPFERVCAPTNVIGYGGPFDSPANTPDGYEQINTGPSPADAHSHWRMRPLIRQDVGTGLYWFPSNPDLFCHARTGGALRASATAYTFDRDDSPDWTTLATDQVTTNGATMNFWLKINDNNLTSVNFATFDVTVTPTFYSY